MIMTMIMTMKKNLLETATRIDGRRAGRQVGRSDCNDLHGGARKSITLFTVLIILCIFENDISNEILIVKNNNNE
jgi:hypothetical protein